MSSVSSGRVRLHVECIRSAAVRVNTSTVRGVSLFSRYICTCKSEIIVKSPLNCSLTLR